jgi:hypothetical protein
VRRILGPLALLVAAGCMGGECIAPALAPVTPAARCGECHQAEMQGWRESPHGAAYVSGDFKEQTHDYAAQDCVSCHAPAGFAVASVRPPKARQEARGEGVTCVSCHALGADAHPGASTAELFADGRELRSAAFCGRCHEDTLREWTAIAGKKLDCCACHMPRTGEGAGIHADHSLKHDRDTLSRYAVLAEVVEARRAEGGRGVRARLALENFAADHAMPTGGYGFRDLRVTVELVDRTGRPLAARTLDLLVTGKGEEGRALAARERRELAIDLADADGLGVAVRARLEKAGPSGPDPLPKGISQREVE